MKIADNARIEVCDGAQMARYIDEWWDDRVSYTKYCIGITPTNQQGDALKALDKHDSVSIKSGHGTGKSSLFAWCIHHYLDCRTGGVKVPCTAPSKHQLQDVLWAEVKKWHDKKLPLFADRMEWTRERYFHKVMGDNHQAVARTATKENPTALQGFHAEYVLKVMDEAPGVHDDIWDVWDGAHGRQETKELNGGNPTRLEGSFWKIHNDPKFMTVYKRLTFSCLKSLVSEGGNCRDQDVEKIAAKFGVDSNMYRVRVLGEFPLRDGDSFIPFDLVSGSLYREILEAIWKAHPVVFGVDVAYFGDDETVIAIRQGDIFHPYHVLRGMDTFQTASYVKALANIYKPTGIFVDVIGWGAGVHDNLSNSGFPSYGVNVAESPALDPHTYLRLRDELWGNARDWFEARRGVICNRYKTSLKGNIIEDDTQIIVGEWTTPKYHISGKGKIVIESKEDLKRRGVGSPNRADAHNLTFAQPTAAYKLDDAPEDGENDRYQPLDPECGY
ncbi:MAG: hypothetical protein FD174_2588 [Geobacteraceae bacterium]|nr:MAG: hypothetical protein FD174_2588 [Geobacteraceae bacterium]